MIDLKVGDISAGGCILTAAELESSKTYVPTSDGGWNILHALPVAEQVLGRSSICLREQLHPDAAATTVELVKAHCRIYRDFGPARSVKYTNPCIVRDFHWGPLFTAWRGKGNFLPGWPKLTLVECIDDKKVDVIKVNISMECYLFILYMKYYIFT